MGDEGVHVERAFEVRGRGGGAEEEVVAEGVGVGWGAEGTDEGEVDVSGGGEGGVVCEGVDEGVGSCLKGGVEGG